MASFPSFSNSAFFENIPPGDLLRDCPSARRATVRHRGFIYTPGESVPTIFCVLEGQVILSKSHTDGTPLTTALLARGDFFGPPLRSTTTAEETARAKGRVTLWQTPAFEFWRLLSHHPASSLEFITALARRCHQLERRLEGLAFKRVEVRLAEMFHELSGGFISRCEHGLGQHLRLTQQELADLVGATRPVVSTLLNRLRKKGVLGYTREYICVRRIEDIDLLIHS